ncbi:DEAD/DEAH box helicase [Patescibacteria group bacterium]|nr:MAG: DEAD/DEAH box helicase [Patescibacteria group bacterium]
MNVRLLVSTVRQPSSRKVFMQRKSSFKSPSTRGGKVFRNNKFGGGNRRRNGGGQHGKYIDPSRFVNTAVERAEEAPFVPEHSFNDFGLLPQLEKALAAKGYSTPTPIQDGAIKPAMEGRDVIGLANTGTGKTAAFTLPIIHRLVNQPQLGIALIMAPTRELAVQIDDEFKEFAKHTHLKSALCLGGVSIHRQIAQLRRRPQVIIGTPGRLKDLFNNNHLPLNKVGVVVLDEADHMLDMGFIQDIRFLLGQLPDKRQSLCFSATLTPEIKQLIHGIMTDPVTVSVRTGDTSSQVEQNVIRGGSKEDKFRILEEMLRQPDFEKVLIFGQTKFGVQRLADNLTRIGIAAEAIHGNKTQPKRQKSLRAFKSGQVSVLVATDVAARGLDIPKVSHVINFDQPATYEDYIHRIGRTGRAGRTGQALTFI